MALSLTYNDPSTHLNPGELRLQLNTIIAAQRSTALEITRQFNPATILINMFQLPPHTFDIDSTTGLVFDHSKTTAAESIQTVTRHLSEYLLATVPAITMTPHLDGTVRDEPLAPKIEKMLQFVVRTAFFQTSELIFAAYLVQRLVEADMASGRPPEEWAVSNNNIGTVLVVSLLLSNKINRDIPIRSSWWAMAFGIPQAVLNSSEEHFLVLLNYEVSPTDLRVVSLLQKVLDGCSC
ncbi:hypothetical protein BLNAU_20267 [Blattamonas nauphoetae]|uniref:Uncharacterized protein n=1 Tax=Blattamonas nauphoetae TaxID=2049346 RepID=A0ABQ9WZ50_9EUKA|nr:hypothetical protein BLNAU_20267 [Blattamonas nauphoetae]